MLQPPPSISSLDPACSPEAAQRWHERTVSYWNTIAADYDDLYHSDWSRSENQQIRSIIGTLLQPEQPHVLDLGCGTGLGYQLCRSLAHNLTYHGLDISPQMISICRQRFPELELHIGSMSQLSPFPADHFDLVMSLFSSFSYNDDPHAATAEIYRVLKPGGALLITVLGRWSLRKLLQGKWAAYEEYQTRQSHSSLTAPSWTFSPQTLAALFADAGFCKIRVTGQGLLAGCLEYNALWSLDSWLARRWPHLCHSLILTAHKPD
jgi:SAM-dependent methyltransferase